MLLLDKNKKQEGTIYVLTFIKPASLEIAIELKTTLTAFAGWKNGGKSQREKEKNGDALEIISAQFTFFSGLGPARPFIFTFSALQLL